MNKNMSSSFKSPPLTTAPSSLPRRRVIVHVVEAKDLPEPSKPSSSSSGVSGGVISHLPPPVTPRGLLSHQETTRDSFAIIRPLTAQQAAVTDLFSVCAASPPSSLFKTRIVRKSINPRWDQWFALDLCDGVNLAVVEVWQWYRVTENKLLGIAVLSLVPTETKVNDQIAGLQGSNEQAAGQIYCRVIALDPREEPAATFLQLTPQPEMVVLL